MINPIPWFPGCGRLERYRNYDRIPSQEVIDGIEVFHPRFPVVPKYFKFFDAISYRAVVLPLVQRLYSTYPFDLIDLHWTYPDLPAGVALKEKYGKKMLVTLRGKEAFHIGEGRIRERLIRKNLLRADAVISLSKELQAMAVGVGVPENRCRVIRNGVDTNTFYYMDQAECRRKLGLNEKEKILLSVGSLSMGKGFDRLIKSIPMLLEQDPKWKMYIVGSHGPAGDCRDMLDRLVEHYSLQQKIIFQGTVKNAELPFWYNAVDIFCLASRSEGSPNVLNEALACGCPAVATNVGAVEEILKDRKLGVLVGNSADAIRDGLLVALKSRQWDRHGIAAYQRKFDWHWCADRVIAVYNLLC